MTKTNDTRKRLPSKALWNRLSFNKLKVSCTYEQSVEVIKTMHDVFYDYLETKRRPICLRKHIGYLDFIKVKPSVKNNKKNIVLVFKEGKAKKELNHHTQGYIYRYIMKFAKTTKMAPYRFFPTRKHNRALAQKIFKRELR